MCFTVFPNSFYGPGTWPHLWKNAMFRLQLVCNFSGMLQDSLGENTARVSASFSINIWKKITFLTATEPNLPHANLLPEITSHCRGFFPHLSVIPAWGSGDGTADPRHRSTSSPSRNIPKGWRTGSSRRRHPRPCPNFRPRPLACINHSCCFLTQLTSTPSRSQHHPWGKCIVSTNSSHWPVCPPF